jgi:hypothetical protein
MQSLSKLFKFKASIMSENVILRHPSRAIMHMNVSQYKGTEQPRSFLSDKKMLHVYRNCFHSRFHFNNADNCNTFSLKFNGLYTNDGFISSVIAFNDTVSNQSM